MIIEKHCKKQDAEEQQKQEIIERFENADSIDDFSVGIEHELRDMWVMKEAEPKTEEQKDKYSVFDEMSENWDAEDKEGFALYEIPEGYADTGGYFPESMQIYTYSVCKQYGVRYDLVVALIENESGYVFDSVGDDGNSFGYMQIYESAHTDRMKELGCDDLTNPYQNVRIGIDYLAELIERYGTIQEALAAYNYGERGARENLWNNGIYVYSYNEKIMNRMKEIKEELSK